MEGSCNEQVEIVSKSVSRLPMLTLPIHPSAYDDSPSGCSTPPFYSSASVPFKWEEEPGKPIPCTTLIQYSEPICMKKLIPPPRMSSVEYKVTRAPSPNTVLNRSSLRLVEGSTESGLLGHMERTMSGRIWKNKKKVRWGMFGSWSWRSGRSCKMGMREGFGGSFVYPSYVAAGFDDGRECCSEYGGESDCVGEQVKMRKLKKNRSFLNLSQVLPWKTSKSKKDGA